MSLLILGKDILRLLIKNYFDGKSAFSCFRVCKLLNKYANMEKDVIIKKYLIYLNYENNREYIEDLEKRMCPICNAIMNYQKDLKKHLEKHKKKKSLIVKKQKIPASCIHCDVPFIGNTDHPRYCQLKRIGCAEYRYIKIFYPWIKSLCQKKEGYIRELRHHKCLSQCRECGEIKYGRMEKHHLLCERRMDMIYKYRIYEIKLRRVNGLEHDVIYQSAICYNCLDENCKCICKKCGNNDANIYIENNNIVFVCRNCAECNTCHKKWNDFKVNKRVWKMNEPPYCLDCFKTRE